MDDAPSSVLPPGALNAVDTEQFCIGNYYDHLLAQAAEEKLRREAATDDSEGGDTLEHNDVDDDWNDDDFDEFEPGCDNRALVIVDNWSDSDDSSE